VRVVHCADESSIEVKTETDPDNDQLRPYSSTVCDEQSPAKISVDYDEHCLEIIRSS